MHLKAKLMHKYLTPYLVPISTLMTCNVRPEQTQNYRRTGSNTLESKHELGHYLHVPALILHPKSYCLFLISY